MNFSIKTPAFVTSAELFEQAEAAAIQEAKDAEVRALRARIRHETQLALATRILLDSIDALLLCHAAPSPTESLADFRKELTPLAASYGVKIVLIGDKSQATLVK